MEPTKNSPKSDLSSSNKETEINKPSKNSLIIDPSYIPQRTGYTKIFIVFIFGLFISSILVFTTCRTTWKLKESISSPPPEPPLEMGTKIILEFKESVKDSSEKTNILAEDIEDLQRQLEDKEGERKRSEFVKEILEKLQKVFTEKEGSRTTPEK